MVYSYKNINEEAEVEEVEAEVKAEPADAAVTSDSVGTPAPEMTWTIPQQHSSTEVSNRESAAGIHPTSLY